MVKDNYVDGTEYILIIPVDESLIKSNGEPHIGEYIVAIIDDNTGIIVNFQRETEALNLLNEHLIPAH